MIKESDVKRGLIYFDQFGQFRVMAVAEGWYMARRKGAMTVCYRVKDLVEAINADRLYLTEQDSGK